VTLIENRSRSRFLALANTPLIFERLALRSFSNLSPLGEGIWKPIKFICLQSVTGSPEFTWGRGRNCKSTETYLLKIFIMIKDLQSMNFAH